MGLIDFLEPSCSLSAILVVYGSIRMVCKGGALVRLADLFSICCDRDV